MHHHCTMNRHQRRYTMLMATLIPIILAGCGSDDKKKSTDRTANDTTHTGTFIDSPVSGLNYSGENTNASLTDENGQFQYLDGETITFSIGELTLGSTVGAEEVTPLSITDGATDVSEQIVNNKLVLLQTLDADGDLNNGIQITEAIRSHISDSATSIHFDQSTTDFRTILQPLIEQLEIAEAFSDTDPRPRAVTMDTAAVEHFDRAMSKRKVVKIESGDIRGFEPDDGNWQFLGIPYAQPPLGDLRWRPPVAAEPWPGIRDAIAWGDQAAQNPGLQGFGEGGMSEDSLYLNVTAPNDATDLPVMVWFHGGGFTALTGNTKPFNNANALVQKNVIQVTVNHRLGPFGYIAHPELSAESGYNGSGNYGQMDLIAALKWVQNNIAAFGGNPDNVTIFGESGGGRKVLSLMASPEAAGLFHKAISQSGTLIPDTRSLADAEAIGSELQTQLGATSIEDMRQRNWVDVVTAATELTPYTNVDNQYLPDTERVSFEEGYHNDVPFMFVINTNDTPDPTNTVIEVFPWMATHSESNYFATLFSHQPSGWKDLGVEAYHGAELAYLFAYPQSVATHYALGLVIDPATGESLEIGDLNGNGIAGSDGDPLDVIESAGFDSTDYDVINQMLTIWTNFAKTGNPSVPMATASVRRSPPPPPTTPLVASPIEYPIYDAQSQMYVEISDTTEVKSGIANQFSITPASTPSEE